MTSTTVYERLEEWEVELVRAYRRAIWRNLVEFGEVPTSAADQVREAIASYVDAWADGLRLDEVVAATFRGVRVGDLSPAKRSYLVGLLSEEAA